MNTSLLPEPILFHPLKHHLQYIRHFVNSSDNCTVATIKSALQTIGASQLDLYTGRLTPEQIAQETIIQLKARELLTPESFRAHLTAINTGYFIITLSDQTDWVLRWGLQETRHVHLHPARYSENTTRVKATTLKTAIATLIYLKRQQTEPDLSTINKVRREWLTLPPVKELEKGVGVLQVMSLLTST